MTSTNARIEQLEVELAKLKLMSEGDRETPYIVDSAFRAAAEEADVPLTRTVKRTFDDLNLQEYSRFRKAIGVSSMSVTEAQQATMHDAGAYRPGEGILLSGHPEGLKERGIGQHPCSHEHDEMKGRTHPFDE